MLEVGSEGIIGLSKTSEIPEKGLNELGVNGWELAEQINMENGATQALIFKRPISMVRKEELEKELQASSGFFGKIDEMVEESKKQK